MRHPSAPTLGVGDAWRTVALELGPSPPWVRGHQPLLAFTTDVDPSRAALVPVGLVALVVAATFAIRRRAPAAVFAASVGLGLVGAVVALARLLGPLFFWIPEWTRALGFACWVVVGWCAYESLGAAVRRRVDRVAVPLLAVAVLVFGAVLFADAVRVRPVANPSVDAIHRLARAAVPEIGDRTTLVTATVDPTQLLGSDPGTPSLVLDLDRAGANVVVDPSLADHYGKHRADPAGAELELRLFTDRDPIPAGFRIVGAADLLSREQRSERTRLEAENPALGPDVPPADRLRYVQTHPEARPVAEALEAIPDLPVLTLAIRPLS